MHRWAFYLSVALLAFGLGSLAVYKFFRKPSEKPVIAQTIKTIEIEESVSTPNLIEQNIGFFKQKGSFKCQDKFLLAVWKHLRKDKDLKEVFNRGIQNKGLSDCSEIIGIDKLIDLNGDGKKEAIVSGKSWLNGANNLSIWIVRKIGENYKIILEDSTVDYAIKTASTNNFQDVFTEHHASCCSSYQTTYKFNKGKYQEDKCLFVDYGTTGIKTVKTCAEENLRIEKEFQQNKVN